MEQIKNIILYPFVIAANTQRLLFYSFVDKVYDAIQFLMFFVPLYNENTIISLIKLITWRSEYLLGKKAF